MQALAEPSKHRPGDIEAFRRLLIVKQVDGPIAQGIVKCARRDDAHVVLPAGRGQERAVCLAGDETIVDLRGGGRDIYRALGTFDSHLALGEVDGTFDGLYRGQDALTRECYRAARQQCSQVCLPEASDLDVMVRRDHEVASAIECDAHTHEHGEDQHPRPAPDEDGSNKRVKRQATDEQQHPHDRGRGRIQRRSKEKTAHDVENSKRNERARGEDRMAMP